MQVVLEVVSLSFDFSHVVDTFTGVSTAVSSVMVQVKVTFVPLIVGCIVSRSMVGTGTVKQKWKLDNKFQGLVTCRSHLITM